MADAGRGALSAYRALWAYPWDLLDRGPSRCLAEIADLGFTAASVACAYHSMQAFLPENPRRIWHTAPASALYFRPDRARYGALTPPAGEPDEPFAAVAPAVAAAGLDLVAWLVLMHSSLAREHPELAVHPLGGPPQPGLLCPAQPAVRQYAVALAAEVDERFAPAALDLETPGWAAIPHHHHGKVGVLAGAGQRYLMSLCRCAACRELGADDLEERLTRRLRDPAAADISVDELLAEDPQLAAFQARREAAVTALVADIRAAVRARVHVVHIGDPRVAGSDLRGLSQAADRVTVLAYGSGYVEDLRGAAEACGPERIVAGLTLLHPETPDAAAFLARLDAAAATGVGELSVYHHSLVGADRLRWAALSPRAPGS